MSSPADWGLTPEEYALLRGLSSPARIQAYLDTLAINFEKKGETCLSPREVMRQEKAHCLEGALVAALALWLSGEEPLLLNLKTTADDDDHAVALYKKGGYWGAISKTNHATLRFRDPIYKNVRELAASYFHEYFLNSTGEKTLRAHSSRPFSLKRFGTGWITSDASLWDIAYALRAAPHSPLYPSRNRPFIRKADAMERKAGRLVEWTRKDPGT